MALFSVSKQQEARWLPFIVSEQALTILISLSSRAPTAVSDPVHKVGVVYMPFSSVFSCFITKVLHREMRR